MRTHSFAVVFVVWTCGCAGAGPTSDSRPPDPQGVQAPAPSSARFDASQWYSLWLNAMTGPDAGEPASSTGSMQMISDSQPGAAGAGAADGGSAGQFGMQPASGSGGAGVGGSDGSGGSGTPSTPSTSSNQPAGGTTSPASGSNGTPPAASGDCFDAHRLWAEDFESGDYRNWTSQTYNDAWGDDCQSNAITTALAHGGTHSQRSQIVCPYTADNVQRGYGGLQFSGDTVMSAYTNQGVGIDAPHGIVTVMWMRLDSPTTFQNGKWVNFWTVSGSCDYTDEVLTLGLEDPSGKLAAAHYPAGGGTRTFEPNAQALPRGRWVRITVYVNYYDDVMHVWQDGQSLEHVTFHRDLHTMCQFHWGLYASADNDNIVLYEDDKSFWKLNEDWTDFSREPDFTSTVPVCNGP